MEYADGDSDQSWSSEDSTRFYLAPDQNKRFVANLQLDATEFLAESKVVGNSRGVEESDALESADAASEDNEDDEGYQYGGSGDSDDS